MSFPGSTAAAMLGQSKSPVGYLVLAVAAALAGCAAQNTACAPSEQTTVQDVLYFGLSKPSGGIVTTQEWDEFLRSVVTPLFPAGLTAWPASGQWRGENGRVVREDSRVLQLLHPADAASERAIRQIVADYKQRFAQEAVLRVRAHACTSF
jgi:hypothetical protein